MTRLIPRRSNRYLSNEWKDSKGRSTILGSGSSSRRVVCYYVMTTMMIVVVVGMTGMVVFLFLYRDTEHLLTQGFAWHVGTDRRPYIQQYFI